MVGETKKKKGALVLKNQGPMAEIYFYNKILMRFFWGREDEDKRTRQNLFGA